MQETINKNSQLKYGFFVASLTLVFAILNYLGKFIFIFQIFGLLELISLFVLCYSQVEVFDLSKKSITNRIIFAIITYVPVFVSFIFITYINFWNPFELLKLANQVGTIGLFVSAVNQYFVNVILLLVLIFIAIIIEQKFPTKKLFRGLQEYIQKLKVHFQIKK